MKKQQEFQIVGLGSFKTFPIKQKAQEFPRVTNDGKAVEKKAKVTGTKTEYAWFDEEGNEYADSKIFYDIGGKKIQKIKRTEKVVNYETVDKTDMYDLADGVNTYCVDCDETTRGNFDKEIGVGNSVKFVLKKSSTGTKFHIAYLYRSQGIIMMTTGLGSIGKGIKKFCDLKESEAKVSANPIQSDVVEVSADEIEMEMLATL